MAELSEDKLMLLDTLMYLDCGFQEGMTVQQLVKELNQPAVLDRLKYDKALTRKEVETLLQAISADPQLMDLTIAKSVDGEIRAACFVDSGGDAVIAYRGTGGTYVAWDDNFQGGYLAETDMQEQALAFAQECAENYDNITVTGHSKGGNMAQYVTVLMGDKIDRCVSFDGQGFSQEFLEKYAVEIEANKSKIRSVCSYNDFVNILLFPIAGEIVYLDNDNFAFPGGHYLFDLYTNPNNKVNEKGEYVTSREQDWLVKQLEEALRSFVTELDDLNNPAVEFALYSLFGTIAGVFMGHEKNIFKIVSEFFENFNDYVDYYFQKWKDRDKDTGIYLGVNTEALRDCSSAMAAAAQEIEELRVWIQKLQKRMATNIIDGVAIGLPLQAVLLQLDNEGAKLRKLAAVLNSSAGQYDAAESLAREKAV